MKWTYELWSHQIADTGDYNGGVTFTNGKKTLVSGAEDLEEEDLKKFCELLDLMPDLYSEQFEAKSFENSIFKKNNELMKEALQEIEFSNDPDHLKFIAKQAFIN